MPAGKVSLTVVVPVELDGPALATVIRYFPVLPAVNVPCAVFVTERSKLVVTGVGPDEAGPLFAPQVGHSFGFDTPAVLAGRFPVTPAPTFTSRINMELPPAAMTFALVQVTLGT